MKNKIITCITFLIIIIVWYITSLNVNTLFVPSPAKVLNNAKILFDSGQLLEATWFTFRRILLAACLAGVISIPIGLLIHNFQICKHSIEPIVNLCRYVPVTAFYPLLIMWLGIGEKMKVMFLFIACFVYMMPSTVLALDEINNDLIDTAYTIGMNKIQAIIKVQLPYALPSILNSFVMCFGIGFTYCAVVETINAVHGLGHIIQQGSARGKTDLVFLGIIMIMIISFAFDNIAKWIIKKVCYWRYVNDRIE